MTFWKKVGLGLVFVVALAAGGGLINAIAAGLVTSRHPSGVIITDAKSDAQIDTRTFIEAFEGAYAAPWRRPSPIWGGDHSPSMLTDGCGYSRNDTEALLKFSQEHHPSPSNMVISEEWMMADPGSEFYDVYLSFAPDKEVEKRTTSFGRGFLTACLQTAILRPFCAPTAKAIIKEADAVLKPERDKMREEIFRAGRNAGCHYLDGLRAKMKGADFLPKRLE